MISFSAATLLLLAFVYFSLKLLSNFQATKRFKAECTRRGCQPIPILPSKDPFGLLRLIEALKAGRQDRMPQYVASLIDQPGADIHTVQVKLLNDNMTVTRDPENVETIFAKQTSDFDIGPARLECFRPLLGIGLTTSTGEAWRHSRALLRPQFSREQISDLGLEERHFQALMGVIDVKSDGRSEKLDLQPLFSNLTHDTATEFLYGHSVNSQEPAEAKSYTAQNDSGKVAGDLEFGHHLEAGKSWLYERMVFGKLGWLFSSAAFTQHCKEVHKYVDRFVHARLREGPNEKSGASSKSSKFILLNELARTTQNPLELRNETLHVLSAGWDTTSALLGWLFYFLARNPHIFTKLRSIILSDFSASIDFRSLNNCRYLQNCINETFRVAAIIPVLERVCTQDTTLPRGGGPSGMSPVFLPKDSRVLISTYGMQHRADIWGTDVAEFRPERWEGEKIGGGWDFVPFAGGPRKCIGRKSALTLLKRHNEMWSSVADLRRTIRSYGSIIHHCPIPAAIRRDRECGAPWSHQVSPCFDE